MDLSSYRNEYLKGTLRKADLKPDPYDQFEVWMRAAIEAKVHEPNAFVLGTCGKDGRPSQRVVLCKGFDRRGVVFYTNLGSRKARQIAENPLVSGHFFWAQMERQVSVIGRVERVSTAEALKYFLSRPRESQLGAWASRQSEVVSTRSLLEGKLADLKARFMHGEVSMPEFWGGFRIVPESFEFWQGGAARIHDRFLYSPRLEDGGTVWDIARLSP